MAGKRKNQQPSAPKKTEPEKTAAAQQQSAPPPVPEEEPARAQAPERPDKTNGEPPQEENAPADGEALTEGQGAAPAAQAQAAADAATGEQPPQGDTSAQEAPAQTGPEAQQTDDDTTEEAPPAADAPAEEKPAAEAAQDSGADGEENEESEEEHRRVAEMTRTVQISLEQIMANMADITADADSEVTEGTEEEGPDGEETIPAEEEEAPEPPPYREPSLGRRIGRAAGLGVLSITRWLLLVLFFVAVIAAMGIAFLYRGATPDLIPKISVTLGGQSIQPTAYDWNVPVIKHLFSRRYQGTLSEEAQPLQQPLEGIRPELVVTPQEFETELVLTDSSENVLFDGSVFDFGEFAFDKDGTYTAELTVVNKASRFDVNAVEGSQTYDFTFDISLNPSVRLDSSSAQQGDIIAVVASGIPLSDKPSLVCGFENPGFVPAQNGWIAYVPIPVDAEPGEYAFTVKSRSHTQTLTLSVHEHTWHDQLVMEAEELNWAYIGPDNTPPEVQEVLKQNEETSCWHDEGFAMPYDLEVTPELEFGMTETVDGEKPVTRRNINLVATIPSAWFGSDLVSPAAGRVVLAADLGGEKSAAHGTLLPNKTVVVDHGGGLKTVYYNLNSIDVAVGDTVEQGQKIGTCQLTVCIGAYVGDVPVNSSILWQGKCNAVKYY